MSVLATAGAVAFMAGPAHAGVWVNGGFYSSEAECRSTGAARVENHQYEAYTCTFGTKSCVAEPTGSGVAGGLVPFDRCGERGYFLRGYMN
ncbi:hypothetical protein AB0B63_02270 [Micromonospora sp. NPDC049081]|uniref:hypothetical protein n=1 Tax=Micromonospora sp. NPDC049081 TaxID=3155150 RepID=UPI00340D3D47